MAWTTQFDWTTGDDITAARLDTYLKDNTNFLYNAPACRVYNSANISVADATLQALTFNTERKDTDTMHSTAVNTGRITFTTAGFYGLDGHVEYTANVGGNRRLAFRVNGSTYIAKLGPGFNNAAFTAELSLHTSYQFAAADYAELIAYQNSGGALNVLASGNYSPEFAATWLAA